ncbi:DUF4347 domain-containing protein [Nostoc sp. MG11]|uniref:DUF4347 domain-containing protein n=1 Tax=Nostoc sp. MG11 TaxID=2721166 RepID=UPI0018690205|nr:DUF4347 domain-containing protein [Nostoc sp. MG11]
MSIDILDLSALTALIKALKSCNDSNVFNNTHKLLNYNHSQEIVFIDSAVKNCQALAQKTIPDAEVVILNDTTDKVNQITKLLKQRRQITAIHIFCDQTPSSLHLLTIPLPTYYSTVDS